MSYFLSKVSVWGSPVERHILVPLEIVATWNKIEIHSETKRHE